MGYEFRLARAEDVHEELTFEFGGAGPVEPECEELKRRTAAALVAANPQLWIFAIQYEEIAAFEKITVEEARRRYRYVELNGREKGNGIQIVLFDRSAVVRVPWWHAGASAAVVFEEVLEYMRLISRETGYKVFDDQIEKEIDLAHGLDESLTCYQDGCARKWPLWLFKVASSGRENASLKNLFKSKKRKK